MLGKLHFSEGAVPGKPIKRKTTSGKEDEAKRRKLYEDTKRSRSFQRHWTIGRQWLKYDKNMMNCNPCKEYWGKPDKIASVRNDSRRWIEGTNNFKLDTIISHEKSKMHKTAIMSIKPVEKSQASKTLKCLRETDREQVMIKFRNAHAVAKWDLSFKTYARLCELDKVKGLQINTTYENDKSAKDFVRFIAKAQTNELQSLLEKSKYFSLTVDGCTDFSGDEQESIYIHLCCEGVVYQKFLCFVSPQTTSAQHIYDAIVNAIDDYLNQDVLNKLVGITCDGASNMMGIRKGVTALFKQTHPKLVTIHCLAHRLELSIKDGFKQNKLYDKAITLLLGLYYHYKKSSKQKNELQLSFKSLKQTVILPTRVGGTRWIPHIMTSLTSFFQGYKAIMNQLSTASHTNPKAEGLYKLASDGHLLLFLLWLKETVKPLQKLSLFLQRQNTTLADVSVFIDATRENLLSYGKRSTPEMDTVLRTKVFKENTIKFKGKVSFGYRQCLVQSINASLEKRLNVDAELIKATQIGNLSLWPDISDKTAIIDYGDEEVTILADKFGLIEEVLQEEWRLAKSILYRRYGDKLMKQQWKDIHKALNDQGVSSVLDLLNLIHSLPPTSVFNERCFSHMKLMKTERRCRLTTETMSDIMTVKLESSDVSSFDPTAAVDLWACTPSGWPRRPNFKRKSKETVGGGERETVGDRERETVGDGESETVGDIERETSGGGDGERESVGDEKRETVRDGERETVGDGERETVGDGERETVGDRERESVGGKERESVWDGERETVGDRERESVGDGERERQLEMERETVGDRERESVGDGERETVGDGERESVGDGERETVGDGDGEGEIVTEVERADMEFLINLKTDYDSESDSDNEQDVLENERKVFFYAEE